jgi:hypothetical protein
VTNQDCVWAQSGLPFYPITTSGGLVYLTTIINASYSAALVPPGTDPDTGAPLPPVDPDPDGTIPPFLDCRIDIDNCPPTTVVPEPGAVWLLSAGLAMLGVGGWRRRG